MCWFKRPMALGGAAGAFGCAFAGVCFAGVRFAAFFATGFRAGALFLEADFSDAFFRAGMDSSFILRQRCLPRENDEAWVRRRQGGRMGQVPTWNISFFQRPMHGNKRKGDS